MMNFKQIINYLYGKYVLINFKSDIYILNKIIFNLLLLVRAAAVKIPAMIFRSECLSNSEEV